MNTGTAFAAAGLFVTLFTGFAATMRALGRIEQRMDIMWAWYLEAHREDLVVGGRRRSDPPVETAHDNGRPASGASA